MNNSYRRSHKSAMTTMILLIVCLVLVVATVVLGILSIRMRSQKHDQDKKIEQYESKDKKSADQIQALQTEVSDKAAYIDEWSGVFDHLEETSGQAVETQSTPDSQFSSLYPELVVDNSNKTVNTSGKKIVHLTFDDGPSDKTGQVLDLLDQYGIKATFFVTYSDKPEIRQYYKQIVDRGHTIAVHTASHDYKKIYSSVESYLEDFNKVYQTVYEETGVKPVLFRYPGGSTNVKGYAAGAAINAEMKRRGFIYYDWNVSSGDGGNQATEESILQWVTDGVSKRHESVVLMHDTRKPTVAILPEVLKQLTEMDCVFEPLDSNSKKVQFWDKIY